MTDTPALRRRPFSAVEKDTSWLGRIGIPIAIAIVAAAFALAVPRLVAQASPHIATVDPVSGKVNDTITVTGEDLDKAHVTALFLSDKKSDFKASVVQQAADKVLIKVPQVAPGEYNVSIQIGNTIFIQPVHFTVEQ